MTLSLGGQQPASVEYIAQRQAVQQAQAQQVALQQQAAQQIAQQVKASGQQPSTAPSPGTPAIPHVEIIEQVPSAATQRGAPAPPAAPKTPIPISQRTPGGPAYVEDLPPKETKPASNSNVPKVITLTSGNDKYVVEVNGERRYMTSAEIEKAGGTVSDAQKQANVLNQISQTQGFKARETQEKEFSIDNAAKKLAADQDMSLKDARDTIKRFMDNPAGREFTHASPETISALLKTAPLSVAQYEQFRGALSSYYARSVVQVGINKAASAKNPNPEYISREDSKRIQQTDKNGWEVLQNSGLDAYNAYLKNEGKYQTAFSVKDAVKDLPASDQKDLISVYNKNGADAFNKALDKYVNDYNAKVEAENKAIAQSNAQSIAEFEKTINDPNYPKDLRDAYKQGGIEAYQKAYDKYKATYDEALGKVKPYFAVTAPTIREKQLAASGKVTTAKQGGSSLDTTIDTVKYLKEGNDPKYLKELGISDKDIQSARDYINIEKGVTNYTEDYFKERGWDTKIPWADFTKDVSPKEAQEYVDHVTEAQNAYYKLAPEAKPSAVLKNVGLSMIPVYGTIRYGKQLEKVAQAENRDLSTGEVLMLTFSGLIDIATIIPIVGQLSAAARGTFMAEEAGKFISTGTRLTQLGKATSAIALAEIRAPFEMVLHPVETVKSGLYSVETVFRGNKIPLSGIESKWNTMRIPVAMVGDEKSAMKLRDAVTQSLIEGKSAEATIGNTTVRLNDTAINRLGKPVMISATPDIRPYMDGATIGKGKPIALKGGGTVIMGEGRDLFVAPTFHSRFAEATSGGLKVREAIPGGILINDQRLISLLEKSGNIYAHTAEIEARLPAGKDIELDKPVQTLVSRTPSGKKLTLLVFGKPYTAAEIADMKIMGSVDTLNQIFQNPVKITKLGGESGAVRANVASEIPLQIGGALVLRDKINELAKLTAKRESLANEVKITGNKAKYAQVESLDSKIDNAYKGLVKEYQSARLPIRTAMVKTAPMLKRGDISLRTLDRVINQPRQGARTGVHRAVATERPTATIRRPITAPEHRAMLSTASRERQGITGFRQTIAVTSRGTTKVMRPRVPIEFRQTRQLIRTGTDTFKPPLPSKNIRIIPTGKATGGVVIPKPPVIPRLKGEGVVGTWTPKQIKSAVGFVMGKLKTKNGLEPMIIARAAPYRDTDVKFFIGETPKGMRVMKDQASAYKTIQLLSGKSPVEFTGRQGFARYAVRLPSPKPGRPGAIAFGTKRIPDQTKRISTKLSGGNSLKNLSSRGKGIFKTPVKNGRLLSRQRIIGL